MTKIDSTASPPSRPSTTKGAGRGSLAFRRSGGKTVLAESFATSPLRLLAPRNHGSGAWVFLANFGGGLVDGDRIDIRVDAEENSTAFVSTQAATKVYRSPNGCSQRLDVQAADGAAVAIVPDPVICFAGARYDQEIAISLAPGASLVLFDGYTSGRAARGERWQFDHFESRTTIARGGRSVIVDATRLDPTAGPIAPRMGRFDAVLWLVAIGPRFEGVREAMLSPVPFPSPGDSAVVAASSLGADVAVVRVAADRFESASRVLRPSFAALSRALGDDPFARKW
ncbi:MAG: urease accessory protein UreD [Polyangiaceae bacterium]